MNTQPIYTCPTCRTYLNRRRTTLLPYIGRWVTRGTADRPPQLLIDKLLDAHHRRHPTTPPSQPRPPAPEETA